MKNETFDYKSIPGWGIDADPENEPTYPIKNYTGDDHLRINYERSEQQPVDVELLQSNERPGPTAVFGNTVPPSGLSGMIRRYAFKHSEDRYRHWIPLILADRINVYEGMIEDVFSGQLPNLIKEKGWTEEWKYNKSSVLKKAAVVSFIGALAATYLIKKRR